MGHANHREPDAPRSDRVGHEPCGINTERVSVVFGMARAMACEIMYLNDEAYQWQCLQSADPDARRWELMRAWVGANIRPVESSTPRTNPGD